MKRPFYLTLVILFLLTLSPPAAGATANLSLDVQAGFDGFYKVDTWTPVRVTVANQGADVQGKLHVHDDSAGFGLANALYAYPVDLPGQSRKQFTLYVPLRGQRRLVVELVDGQGASLLSQKTNVAALNKEALLLGVVANDASLLNPLAKLATVDGHPIAVAHLKLADLPPNPRTWSGLDILVFNDVDTTQLTAAQQHALVDWVRAGGRLLVGGGPNAAQTIAGLEPLLPFSNLAAQDLAVQDLTIQTLPHPIPALEDFVRIPLEDRGPYVVAVPTHVTGRVLIQQGNWPLVMVAGQGLGQVYYLAFDFSLAPLDILASQPQFFLRLMGGVLEPRQRGYFAENIDSYQMRDSLALIPDQVLPSPLTVALYLIIYILVMGPANYFVLRRLKRREWAWFSIPLIILLFSGYGYFSGFRLRGGRPLLRQITVVQAEIGAPSSNVDSFVGVYSPYRADYNLQLDSPVLVESFSPGPGGELTITAGESTIVENLRGDIGGMPAIVAHSHAALPRITANLRYNRASRRLSGNINNDTGQPITHALLVMNNQVLELGTLPPGQTQVEGIAAPPDYYDGFYQRDDLPREDFPRDNLPRDNLPHDPREIMDLASRDMAVRAIFNLDPYDDNPQSNLAGLYLVGWQEDSSVNVKLTNSRGDKISDTLLLVGLPFMAD